jgi:8-oxo-dGDP phosphatase
VSFEVESSEVVYEGFSTVRVDLVRMPDGSAATREIVEHNDAVAVVPLDTDGRVVLLSQYRHALGEAALEIPAGKLDREGEEPEAAARRELLEETGLQADALERLVTFDNSGGWTDEQTTVYLARDVRPGDVPDDFTATAEEADMEIVRLPLEEAVEKARSGEITDAKTLVGLLLSADRG